MARPLLRKELRVVDWDRQTQSKHLDAGGVPPVRRICSPKIETKTYRKHTIALVSFTIHLEIPMTHLLQLLED